MPSEPINHAQIARLAGVSRPTVSRALQNHPALARATREKIQRLATEQGYRPNPLVSALMASRNRLRQGSDTTTLALLTAWPETIPRSPNFRTLLQGAKARAETLGFRVEQFWFNDPRLTARRLNQILISRGIVAVLLGPVPKDQDKLELEWEHFSLACFTPNPKLPVLHRASSFNFTSACLAVRELLALGYRKPCLMLHKRTRSYVLDQWVGGYYAAMSGQPEGTWIQPQIRDPFEREPFLQWCRRSRPDVILSNDTTLWQWLREARLTTAFASLDRHPAETDIAGIDQQSALVGAAAVDLVAAQINRNERGIPASPATVLIEGRWMAGPSIPLLPAPKISSLSSAKR